MADTHHPEFLSLSFSIPFPSGNNSLEVARFSYAFVFVLLDKFSRVVGGLMPLLGAFFILSQVNNTHRGKIINGLIQTHQLFTPYEGLQVLISTNIQF